MPRKLTKNTKYNVGFQVIVTSGDIDIPDTPQELNAIHMKLAEAFAGLGASFSISAFTFSPAQSKGPPGFIEMHDGPERPPQVPTLPPNASPNAGGPG